MKDLVIVLIWAEWTSNDFDDFRDVMRQGLRSVGSDTYLMVTTLPVPTEGPHAGRSDIEIRTIKDVPNIGELRAELRRMFNEHGATRVDSLSI